MKVLYVITNSFWYGDNRALYNLLPHLIKKGIEPFFLIPHNSEAYNRFSEISNNIYTYSDSNIYYTQKTCSTGSKLRDFIRIVKFYLKLLKADKTEYNEIIKKIENEKIDLIHTNNSGCVLGYRISKKLSIPHIWHIREYGDKDANWMYLPSKKLIMNRMNSYNNNNITITEDIRRHFFLSTTKARTIYDGPIQSNTYTTFSERKQYFLYVGRIFPKKGIELLINAIYIIAQSYPDIIMKIAGDGDGVYVEYLKNKVVRLGIEGNIVFLGYRNDIAELMSCARAVIIPSYFEAFGFITAEAMYNGAQVIGFNTAGTKEQMDNVEEHLKKKVCERFTNTSELVTAIQNVIKAPLDAKTLVLVSQYVKCWYSDITSASRVFNYYKEIISK